MHKTNLQYADHPAPLVQTRTENHMKAEKHAPIRKETVHHTVRDVHELLTEKERHACNRATD